MIAKQSSKKRILIRVDSSNIIGTGHAARCLTLAKQLQAAQCHIAIACRDYENNCNAIFQNAGFDFYLLPHKENLASSYEIWDDRNQIEDTQDVIAAIQAKIFDWIIVDNYALDRVWHGAMRAFAKNIFVIDDLANRQYDCDLLLDQNFYKNMETRYQGLVPPECTQLLGPAYAILPPVFDNYEKTKLLRSGEVDRILVCFGSIDAQNQTLLALEAIRNLNHPQINFDIIVGQGNKNKAMIKQICDATDRLDFHCQVPNMDAFIIRADLAIGAGGVSVWERCRLGLPSITAIIADNQRQTVEDLAACGVLHNLGLGEHLTAKDYFDAIGFYLNAASDLRAMSEKSLDLFTNRANSRNQIVETLIL